MTDHDVIFVSARCPDNSCRCLKEMKTQNNIMLLNIYSAIYEAIVPPFTDNINIPSSHNFGDFLAINS